MKVEDILSVKGRRVATVRPEASVAAVAKQLRLEGVGALVVSQDGASVEGIVSERDVVRGLAQHGADLLDLPVTRIMTRAVATCAPDDPVKSVMAEMTRRRVRHLPVVVGGRLGGIVSIGDVVKNRLDEIELEVDVLRDAYLARR